MGKLFLLMCVVLLSTGCERPFVIYNGCNGSWVRVVDGRGNLLVEHLNYGLESGVDVGGFAGGNIELLASGYDLQSNRPLGSATTSRYIPHSSGGSPMSPSQLQPWQITYLQTTDPNGGCRR